MPEWVDAMTLVTVLGIAAVAVVLGMARREPWWAVIATAGGVSLFLLAIRSASAIGDGAELSVFVGALGFGVWVMASERTRGSRRRAA